MSRPAKKPAAPRPLRAKLFRTGGSQAVRLPKECRLPGNEAFVRKVGKSIILTPVPGAFSAEFRELVLGAPRSLLGRRHQQRQERREDVEP